MEQPAAVRATAKEDVAQPLLHGDASVEVGTAEDVKATPAGSSVKRSGLLRAVGFCLALIPATAGLVYTVSTNATSRHHGSSPSSEVIAPAAQDVLSFVVIGDYGRQGKYNQKDVANAMGSTAAYHSASFVLAVGDNVYENGISSASDPLWAQTVTNIYTHPALTSIPWYAVMGNHDWKKNISAQYDGKALGFPNWKGGMSYDVDGPGVTHHGHGLLDMVYIDTDVLCSRKVKQLQANGWISSKQASDAAGMAQWFASWEDAQAARLQRLLSTSSARWKMVAGHHGIYNYACDHGSQPELSRLNAVLRAQGAHAYFNGHDHDLALHRLPNNDPVAPLYVLSGAGSQTRNDIADPKDGSLLFGYGFAGYTLVQLTWSNMTTTFFDMAGRTLYTITTPWVAPPDCGGATPTESLTWVADAVDSRCYAPVPPQPCK